MNGASESVLEALAGALQLDEAERAHLFDLARAAHPTPARPRRRQAKQRIRPEVQWTLDAITGAAAFVSNNRLDILAANQLGLALYSELYDGPVRPVNTARFVFLDPRAETTFGDWDRVASESVAILRSAAGRDPYKPRTLRPRRRTRNTERGISRALGHTQRPLPQHRRQALPPSRRRRPPPDLQPTRPRRRPRPHALHLHRRARLPLRRDTQASRQLGGHRRPRRSDSRDRAKLTRTGRRSLAAPFTGACACSAAAAGYLALTQGEQLSLCGVGDPVVAAGDARGPSNEGPRASAYGIPAGQTSPGQSPAARSPSTVGAVDREGFAPG